MDGRLEGRVVVVVGGTGGLGRSAVLACLREGARVLAVGRNPDRSASLAASGPAVRILVGDATDPSVATEAVRLARESWGRLDALYHVAGGSGRRYGDGPLHEISDGGWDDTLRLNLTSVFYSNRAAVLAFREQGSGGSVVNCSSVLGFSPSPRFFATHAYAAAKAAIIGLTRAAAAQYAAEDIRFNVVAPALVATLMSQRAQADEGILRFIRHKQPLDGGRIGEASDLDGAVIWLLSDESRFVTGQVLAVDGGWGVSDGSGMDAAAPNPSLVGPD